MTPTKTPANKTDRLLQLFLAATVAVFAVLLWDTLRDRVVKVGDIAPEFAITTESGVTVSSSNFPGKVLVLNFWATWCPPCVEETPALERFHKQLKDAGVTVLAISVDKNEAKYRNFIKRFGVTFATAHDPEATISSMYGTYRYPESYVIDKSGRVIEKIVGPKKWTDENVIKSFRTLL